MTPQSRESEILCSDHDYITRAKHIVRTNQKILYHDAHQSEEILRGSVALGLDPSEMGSSAHYVRIY